MNWVCRAVALPFALLSFLALKAFYIDVIVSAWSDCVEYWLDKWGV